MPNILKEFPPELKEAVLLKQVELKTKRKELKASQLHALMEIVKEWLLLIKKPT